MGIDRKNCSSVKQIQRQADPPMRVSWGIAQYLTETLAIGLTEGNEVCRIGFISNGDTASVISEWQKQWPRTRFLAGASVKMFANKPVLLVGTDFQYAVWQEIAKIQFGHVATYKEIASRLSKPGACRAIGTACGANPAPVMIPCHRVIATSGLGGFSGGIEIKKRLLEAELSNSFTG